MLENFVEKIKEIRDLLRHNPNLILYGPPGTGKTYTAKKVASFMLSYRFFNVMVTHWDNHWDNIPNSQALKNNLVPKSSTKMRPALSDEEIKKGFTFFTEEFIDQYMFQKLDIKSIENSPTIFIFKNSDKNSKDSDTRRAWVGRISSIAPCRTNQTVMDCAKFKPHILTEIPFDDIKSHLPDKLLLSGKNLKNLNSGWYIFDIHKDEDIQKVFQLLYVDVVSDGVLQALQDRWAIVQFHPAYNYDDFVRGITVETSPGGQVIYRTLWKVLGKMSWKAKDNPKKPFILIIDEINRANLPAVLGELIYALEYRGEPVRTLYGDELIIPPNLYIIGTMNTADRSAGRIDYAIRRRFTFYPMHAEVSYADSEYGRPLMEAVNNFIKENVDSDYSPEDIMIGHTYFMSKKEEDKKVDEIAYKFLYQVVPLLYEYIQDGLVHAERDREKGYKLTLNRDLETGGENERIYYLRGGRLFKDDGLMKINDLWFMKQENQTQSQNGDENYGTGEQD